MKKIASILFLVFVTLPFADAQSIDIVGVSPTYGCPNTTHNVSVGITSNLNTGISSGIPYDVNISIKDNGNNLLKSFSQTYTDGFSVGSTKQFELTMVPFTSQMTCTITATVTASLLSINQTNTADFVVKYPPTLVMTENPFGTLSISTSMDGYSLSYYLNANYSASIYETTSTSYTPTLGGSYTSKGYDPLTSCLSESASNAISIVVASAFVSSVSKLNIKMYPNPAATHVTISIDENGAYAYEVIDKKGTTILDGNFIGTETFAVGGFPSGNYSVVIKKEGKQIAIYSLLL